MTPRASDSQNDHQSASRIVSVEARTITIPLENPTSFSTRQVFARDYVVVRVRTADGHEGQGFCYGGSRGGVLVASAVQILLAPILAGKSALNVEGLWREMYQETLLHGRAGSVMRAISIVDVALWDRNARAAGLPLAQYLGGTGQATVPAYASGGYYLDGKTPDKLGQEMASYVKMGFKAVKMKVGRGDLKSEEARIRAAREAIGDEIVLTLDANNAWNDLSTAVEYMKRYEPSNPYWIEEPFGPDDIENHAELAQRTPVMVATGEIEAGRWRHKELIEKARRRHPADRRRRLRRHHRVPQDRRHRRQLRRGDVPALVPRPARAPGGVHTQCAVRRIFPGRPGAELPAPGRHPARAAQRRAGRADHAGSGFSTARRRAGPIRRRPLGLKASPHSRRSLMAIQAQARRHLFAGSHPVQDRPQPRHAGASCATASG